MNADRFTCRPIEDRDRDWVLKVIRNWGADFVVTRGRKVFAAELPGFLAENDAGEKVGLVTYEMVADQCEIITLDAFQQFGGIGTKLTDLVRQEAIRAGCVRLWLITTNDNLDAIRFYHRRGFTIAAIHVNALVRSRELKPSIPKIGSYGIRLRDEIEFEMFLAE